MKWIRVSFYITFVILIAGFLTGCTKNSSETAASGLPETAAGDLPEVVVYLPATCQCCYDWVTYLQENGFPVSATNEKDMAAIKTKLGVDLSLRSNHTAVVEGYVIEGHVSVEDIVRLLQERPAITGLAVPGMPGGTPGMERMLSKIPYAPYDVIAFTESGRRYTFSQH
ncbi:MAG: DUF411 domain-containing protein [Rhodothermia bacterium]|nr:MAG: DUF411 domain-containing protein [Rhodothermia bacterium]